MAQHQRRTTTATAPTAPNDDPPVVDVVVLINDEKLLATLREASTAQHALYHAGSADAAIELLVGGHCGILIADLALLHGDTLELLVRLQAQFPELIILAAGRGEEEITVADAISSGCIYRFLHKPVSPARASLFLGVATRRYGELRDVQELALATLKQQVNRPRLGKLKLGVTVVAVVGALCLWWAMDRKPERSPVGTAQLPDDYLQRAQTAFKAGRLTDDSNDNALALYRAALAASPDNTEARSGIQRVLATLDKRVIAALSNRNVVAAVAALDELRGAHPAHPHLAGLNRQLQALSDQIAAMPVQTQPAAPVQATSTPTAPGIETDPVAVAQRISTVTAARATAPIPVPAESVDQVSRKAVSLAATPQIDRARARLAASQLIAPVDDSAVTYLRRARELGEDETRLKIVATDLGTRLLDQVRAGMLTGDPLQSQRDYAAAAALDAEFELGLPNLVSIGEQIQRPGSVAKVAGAESSTVAAVLAADQLPRVREVAAVYPRQAEVDGIEGWVDVDFNIAIDGTPRDLTVRTAHPRGMFDNAALDALREWRFEPVRRNGKAVVQPVTLRIDFSLKK